MYLGIDAGGTKTDICVVDPSGRVLEYRTIEGINAARCGAKVAFERLLPALRSMGAERARYIYAGVAGAGSRSIRLELRELLENGLALKGRVEVCSDAFNALNIECGSGDGIALIAGTGSAAFVRVGGEASQVGGRGYLIDDAGSGYWLGKACLNAVFRQLDGRGSATSLTDAVGKDIARRIPEIYEKGPTAVASFASIVFECARQGDNVARHIFEECVGELELLLRACVKQLNHPDKCVASGGLMNSSMLRDEIKRCGEKLGLEIVFPELPPVCGAVIAAAALDGIDLRGRLYGL